MDAVGLTLAISGTICSPCKGAHPSTGVSFVSSTMSMSAMDGIAYIAFDSYDGLRPYGLPISWLDTYPARPLCPLRVRHYRRLTQHSRPGASLRLTWAGLAPADRASLAGAFLSWALRGGRSFPVTELEDQKQLVPSPPRPISSTVVVLIAQVLTVGSRRKFSFASSLHRSIYRLQTSLTTMEAGI